MTAQRASYCTACAGQYLSTHSECRDGCRFGQVKRGLGLRDVRAPANLNHGVY